MFPALVSAAGCLACFGLGAFACWSIMREPRRRPMRPMPLIPQGPRKERYEIDYAAKGPRLDLSQRIRWHN